MTDASRLYPTLAAVALIAVLISPLAANADPAPEAAPAAQPASALSQAIEAVTRGDLAAAREQFEALHKADPASPEPYLGLAEVSLKEGKTDDAERILKEGIAAAPTQPTLHRALGRLYVVEKKPDDAVASFGRAIEVSPSPVPLQIELADLLSQGLDLPERALPYYQAAIAAQSTSFPAHYGLGVAFSRMQRNELATAEMSEAERLNPADPRPTFFLAELQARAGKTTEALALLDAVLAKQPVFPAAHVAKANLLLGANRAQDAIGEYNTALAQAPNALSALVGLGIAEQQVGASSEAEAAYRRALEVDPRQVIALNNLASLLAAEKRDLDEALKWAQQAVALAPKEGILLDTLGWVLRQRGELAKAETTLQQAVELQPTPEAFTHLGQVRAGRGDKAAATSAFRRALELQPSYAPAQEELRKLG